MMAALVSKVATACSGHSVVFFFFFFVYSCSVSSSEKKGYRKPLDDVFGYVQKKKERKNGLIYINN